MNKTFLIAALRAAEPKLNALACKKEGGWGEEIFARLLETRKRFFGRRRDIKLGDERG